jgi:hypothetical protein
MFFARNAIDDTIYFMYKTHIVPEGKIAQFEAYRMEKLGDSSQGIKNGSLILV